MRSIYTFTLSALGLVILYIVLTSANQRNGGAGKLINSASAQFGGIIKQLQGRSVTGFNYGRVG
jgi:hypothetical protein